MSKGRMEAFSDGVLAILITIMVLNMTVSPSAYRLTICRSCLAAFTVGTMPRRIRVAAWGWSSSRPS